MFSEFSLHFNKPGLIISFSVLYSNTNFLSFVVLFIFFDREALVKTDVPAHLVHREPVDSLVSWDSLDPKEHPLVFIQIQIFLTWCGVSKSHISICFQSTAKNIMLIEDRANQTWPFCQALIFFIYFFFLFVIRVKLAKLERRDWLELLDWEWVYSPYLF